MGWIASQLDGWSASEACEDCEPYGGDELRSLRFSPHNHNDS